MKKKWYSITAFIFVLGMAVSSFKREENLNYVWAYAEQTAVNKPILAIAPLPNQIEFNHFEIPFTGKSFMAFRQAIGFKESQGKYDVINDFGYAGKYQFGGEALQTVGITNRKEFLNNPVLQEEAFKTLLAINKNALKKEIKKYSGKIINKTEITESGILASAHLLGPATVKKYLRNNGQVHITDAYGTTIRSYMKKFGGYDTSIIKADSKARATKKNDGLLSKRNNYKRTL